MAFPAFPPQCPGMRHCSRRSALQRIFLGLGGGAWAVSGCATRLEDPGHKLVWRTLSRGLTSGLTEPTRRVIRDDVTFYKLWALHAAEVARPALPPSVDFTKEMVVVVALGQHPTGGYFVEVVDVELRGRTLDIRIGERTPRLGVYQMQQPTQPYQIIALPSLNARVRFRTVHEAELRGAPGKSRDESESPSPRRAPQSANPPGTAPTAPMRSPRGAAS